MGARKHSAHRHKAQCQELRIGPPSVEARAFKLAKKPLKFRMPHPRFMRVGLRIEREVNEDAASNVAEDADTNEAECGGSPSLLFTRVMNAMGRRAPC
jgi:hypothetical protein